MRGELVEPGDVQVRAVASAYCVEDVEDEASFEIVGLATLEMGLVDSVELIEVGEETEYRVRVWNEGNVSGTNVGISVKLPKGLELVSVDGEDVSRAPGESKQLERTGELAPGEAATSMIGAVGRAKGRQPFEVHLRSDALPRAIEEQEPTRVY